MRVSGKDRDTLQEVIALLRQQDFGIDMQFTNYRTQLRCMSTPAAINGERILRAAARRSRGYRTGVRARHRLGCRSHHRDRRISARRRRQAHSSRAAVAFREAAELPGTRRRPAGRSGRNHPHRDPGSRRHHRRSPDPARPSRGQHPVGKFQVRAGGRLALHAGLQGRGAGAQLPHSRHPDRTNPADGRRRAAADGEAGQAHFAGRTLRSDLPQNCLPVFGVHADGRESWAEPLPSRKRAWRSTGATWGWHSRSWTMCST